MRHQCVYCILKILVYIDKDKHWFTAELYLSLTNVSSAVYNNTCTVTLW